MADGGLLADGSVVRAIAQTAGKGQGNNKWESEAGKNLTFTLYLEPYRLKVEEQMKLNSSVALGIYDFLKTLFQDDIKVKWPNDIMVNRQKIAGILIENVLAGSFVRQSFIGIGLNINQQKFNTPNAISLSGLTGEIYNLERMLEQLLQHMSVRLNNMYLLDVPKLIQQYQQAMYKYGEQASFLHDEKIITAKVEGIDHYGRLKLDTGGALHYFQNKEVEWIKH